MHVAASEGQVRSNLNYHGFSNITLLIFLQLDIVKYLVENGSDVNAEDKFKNTCLNDAVRHKYTLLYNLLT